MVLTENQGDALAVEVQQLRHRYGRDLVLDDLSLAVKPGEFLSLLGPSGCGKSTLLRSLAGLIKPESGHIRLQGQPVFDSAQGLWAGPEDRGLGMVFQDYALWPHMSVEQNVSFPLTVRKTPAADCAARVKQALARVRMLELAHRKPGELSGGQQQRVGLARAIVADPAVLLFDEPLSNLDAGLREALGREISSVVRSLNAAAIYVTHDRNEALGLSDRIAVMQAGRIAQIDTPQRLYSHPSSLTVAEFLQVGPVLEGFLHNGHFTPPAHASQPDTPGIELAVTPQRSTANGPVRLLIPHRALQNADSAAAGSGPLLRVRVERSWYAGEHYEIEGQWLGGQPLLRWRSREPAAPNSLVSVCLHVDLVRCYDAASGALMH